MSWHGYGSLSVRIALVTGPTSGIGLIVARSLARAGFHVIAAGRSPERMSRAVDSIIAAGGSAEPLLLDLASLESVRSAARSFTESGRVLDVLVNNAGIGIGRGQTRDGFEIHFGVNHLGHFLLTRQLSPCFVRGTRIIQMASSVHERARGIDFDRVRGGTRSLSGIDEYAQSKLANILYARELASRNPNWNTYAVHPGLVDTALIPRWSKPLLRNRLLRPEDGGDTPIWCATSPDVAGQSGLYYARRRVVEPSSAARDNSLARELWERSERWCGSELPDQPDETETT